LKGLEFSTQRKNKISKNRKGGSRKELKTRDGKEEDDSNGDGVTKCGTQTSLGGEDRSIKQKGRGARAIAGKKKKKRRKDSGKKKAKTALT